MRLLSVIPVLVLGATIAMSANCFAEGGDGCPEKSICKACKERCEVNPTQCPEDCKKCQGCLAEYE
jgi:hypothetical protein